MQNWFPGHMAKARRQMLQHAALVDVVCEVADARIPASSRNPDLAELFSGKPRMLVLNRSDLADVAMTKKWATAIGADLVCDCKSGRGTDKFSATLSAFVADKLERFAAKGVTGKSVRAMVVGIPNVGKSTLINAVAHRKATVAADRPGVTRGTQWVSVGKTKAGNPIELLDTPGQLWPKIESETQWENLAFTGAIRDEILDLEDVASRLWSRLLATHPNALMERFKGAETLQDAAIKRGCLISGGTPDIERISRLLLDEFRAGKIGTFTLEAVEIENGN